MKRQIMCVAFGLLFTAAMLAGSEAATAAPPKKPKLNLNVYLSTGEDITGLVITNKKNALTIKGKKRRKVYKANIIALDLELSGKAKAKLDKAKGAKRQLAVGDWLLENNYPDLAACAFSAAVRSNKKLQSEVEQAYQKHRKSLPKKFGPNYVVNNKEGRRYILPTLDQVTYAMGVTDKWAKGMKKINGRTHLIETDHYRIYSSWAKSDDRRLKKIYTKLYKALCKQFDVPKNENIWIGKLPIYAFWEKSDFVRFSVDVVGVSRGMAENAGGYAGWRAKYVDGKKQVHRYVVLGPVMLRHMKSKADAKTWFYELLVHESSHAFMGRFINETHIPNWVNEGVAETMASTLVPKGRAGKIAASASRHAVEGSSIDGIFDCRNIPMDSYHYGIAQSVVRFLIKKNRKKFIKFIMLLKAGKSDKSALKASYGMSRNVMKKQWRRYAKRKYRK